jgi:hypothetical protein
MLRPKFICEMWQTREDVGHPGWPPSCPVMLYRPTQILYCFLEEHEVLGFDGLLWRGWPTSLTGQTFHGETRPYGGGLIQW